MNDIENDIENKRIHEECKNIAHDAQNILLDYPWKSKNNQSDLNNKQCWQRLQQTVSKCNLCSELATTRTQIVFGEGNPFSMLFAVGEAPGKNEDIQGSPFVGRSGTLLTKMLNAIQISRADIFITNLIKCHPPENRNPTADEIQACQSHLRKQIDLTNPKIILCLGNFATQNLLQTSETISKIRGKFHCLPEYKDIMVFPLYHPSALLRRPSLKQETWQDLQILRKKLIDLQFPFSGT